MGYLAALTAAKCLVIGNIRVRCVLILFNNAQYTTNTPDVIIRGKTHRFVCRIMGVQAVALILFHEAVAIDDENTNLARIEFLDMLYEQLVAVVIGWLHAVAGDGDDLICPTHIVVEVEIDRFTLNAVTQGIAISSGSLGFVSEQALDRAMFFGCKGIGLILRLNHGSHRLSNDIAVVQIEIAVIAYGGTFLLVELKSFLDAKESGDAYAEYGTQNGYGGNIWPPYT